MSKKTFQVYLSRNEERGLIEEVSLTYEEIKTLETTDAVIECVFSDERPDIALLKKLLAEEGPERITLFKNEKAVLVEMKDF